jgi:hypothetical protein
MRAFRIVSKLLKRSRVSYANTAEPVKTFTLFPEDFTVGGFSPWRLSDDGVEAEAVIRPKLEDRFFWLYAKDAGVEGSLINQQQ